jgi:arylsulfatase A-like enzyme
MPALTGKAIAFIRSQDPSSTSPFFLYLALTTPHTPWLPSENFRDSSDAGLYGDFTVQVDHSVGLVLKELQQLGLEDNTLVFFTSDNGPVWYERDRERFDHQSTYYLRGMKADAYEGGHRMPFLAKWPGHIKAGTLARELVCFTDMLATFSDLVDHRLASSLYNESASILPVLLGEKDVPQIRNEVIIEDWAVIEHSWKYIRGNGSGWISNRYKKEDQIQEDLQGELYHLGEDSTESRNLYFQYPGKVNKMKSVLDSYTDSQISSQ